MSPGSFVLYAGNFDRYQELDRLDGAAALLPDQTFLAASSDPSGTPLCRVRAVRITQLEELRALTFGAGVAMLPRRRPGSQDKEVVR